MGNEPANWLLVLCIAFTTTCAWIGFLSVVDGVIYTIREIYEWWKDSKIT